MFKKLKLISVLLMIFSMVFGVALFGNTALAATDLQGESIYQIMVDRFYDGDPSNNATGEAFRYAENIQDDFRYMHGGDWQGIIDKLDYIKNQGYTAIWISPIGDPQLWGMPDSTGKQWPAAYHGYNVYDPNTANRYFGSADPQKSKEKIKALVDAAHAKGIKVIIDVVPNHVGDYLQGTGSNAHYISNSGLKPGTQVQPAAPFNNVSWYHNLGDIVNWNDPVECENHDLGGLDDIDQDNAAAKNAINASIKNWFAYTGADAARVDASKCLNANYIHSIETDSNIATFGECFDMSVDRVAGYVGANKEWGMLDFPLFQSIVNGFAYGQNFDDTSSGACSLKNIFAQDYKYNGWENHMVTFLDNHDRNRFLTEAGGSVGKLKNALTFLFTTRGIPCVLYGTEQNKGNEGNNYINGIADTWNRWSMVKKDVNGNVITNYFNNTSTDTYILVGKLNQLRSQYEALRTGKQREMWAAPNLYAFSRRVDSGSNAGQEIISVFSNKSSGSQTVTIPLRTESTIAVGTVLNNLLNSSDKVTVQSGGVTGKQITVTVEENSSKVYAQPINDTTPPTAPSNLVQTGKTSVTTSFSWTASTDNVGVAGYIVYRNGTAVNTSLITGTAYTDTGLTADTTYTYYVVAKDAAGNVSPASATISIKTDLPDTQAPTAPSNLAFTDKTSSSVSLTWTASTDNVGVAGYIVYRNGTAVNTSLITGTAYTDTGLAAGTTYTYYVIAKDAAGNASPQSDILSVTTSTGNKATVYYKRGFAAPYIHYKQANGTWTTAPGVKMTDAGATYPGYSMAEIDMGTMTQLEACFNDGNNNWDSNGGKNYFFPAGASTFTAGVITPGTPSTETGKIPVTFTINNATTVLGQNVYIAGSIAELGNWTPVNAIGPASCPNYPTWTITINLPAGQAIQFKAIKKDATGTVVWEGGSNHTYTVPASGSGSVTITWQQ